MDTDKVKELTERINALSEQRRFDIAVLALWAHAKATTGHTYETIRAFTFRKAFLTNNESRANRLAARQRKPSAYCDKNWHNALRLHDGTIIPMPGVQRPTPPPDTPTTVTRKIDL